jgi:DNA polymerase type B, organellar and viral
MKNKNLLTEGIWLYYISNFKYSSINPLIIERILNEFKKDILEKLGKDRTILLQLRVCCEERNIIRNISTIDCVDITSFDHTYDRFKVFWEMKMDSYMDIFELSSLFLAYNIVPINSNIKIMPKVKNGSSTLSSDKEKIGETKFSVYNLPNTMDITKWGECIFNKDYTQCIVLKRYSNVVYNITLKKKEMTIKYTINNKVIFSFIDYMESHDLMDFYRQINIKNKLYFYKYVNGQVVLKTKSVVFNYIAKIKKEPMLKDKFITMDLETRVINGNMYVYCCCIYDGINLYSFYLSDYQSDEELLISAIKSLFLRKYKGLVVFLHNFSHFDAIFLLKILSELSLDNKIKPIINDNNFINLTIQFSKNYNIKFRDSYLLLPASLKKLAISFNIGHKGLFPHKFINNNNVPLNYIGDVPPIHFFEDITSEEYRTYSQLYNNKWNLKEECIKYCSLDVILLHSIIKEFNLQIYKLTRINAIKYPTLSSLSFAIFRSNFLDKDCNIPIINGKVYEFINKSYKGGAVDVYIPSNCNYGPVFRYDVNSLYPYVMSRFDMPIGHATYFEGDIFLSEKDPFGFFEVEVETTNYLEHPILLHKSSHKMFKDKTIAPLGKWIGVYFSEEIKNAKKYGYKFKVLRGYTFERGHIFKNFVDTFYKLKQCSNRNDSLYVIAKLILNSLYGRFGMSPYKDKHIIIDNKDLYSLMTNYEIISSLDLKNGKQLISYKEKENKYDENENYPISNVSIAVASAVTAYARIFMSQFKNSTKFNLFYSDTDCIDINKKLNDNWIGKQLGLMKLEHILEEVVYIAPKVYGGKNKQYEIIKIKGAKKNVKFEDMKSLLIKDNKLLIEHQKWYKNISNRTIFIRDELYSLMVTGNKRQLIYKNNKLVGTKPFIINELNDT